MKRNSFTEILFNFDKMSNSIKLQRMQDFENMVARFQGRKPRIVTSKVPKSMVEYLRQGERQPVAFYNRKDPTKIYIIKFDSGIDALKDIVHEGFHAYVDDFIKGKVNLRTFSQVDKEKFLFEEKNVPRILKYFQDENILQLYDSSFIEERLNYQENSLYLLKFIFDSIETKADALQMFDSIIGSLFYYSENEYRGKEREIQFKISYDEAVERAIKNDTVIQIDITKTKKIIDKIDIELLDFFNKICPYVSEYRKIKQSPMLIPEEKDNLTKNYMLSLNELLRKHIENLLKNKKFGE